MVTVNMHEAKTNLSKLVARAKAGETIVLAKSGEPQARLVPMDDAGKPEKRKLGWLKGEISVPDDIKTPFAQDIEDMFYGNPDKFR